MDNKEIPEDFKKLLDSVKGKRARFVIDTILKKGFCSTEDLKNAGYEHAPRAARDVRELGIPIKTFYVKDSTGKRIGAYCFDDWNSAKKQNLLAKSEGRTALSSKLKKLLIEKYGPVCHLYGEEYPERLLQPDHRIPYEIGGDPEDMLDTDYFMLLCPSANRDKSWACEHCDNWSIKNVDTCKTCYYAFPEHYEHIACKKEKKVDVIFNDDEIALYHDLEVHANSSHESIQDYIKRLIKYQKKMDEKK